MKKKHETKVNREIRSLFLIDCNVTMSHLECEVYCHWHNSSQGNKSEEIIRISIKSIKIEHLIISWDY